MFIYTKILTMRRSDKQIKDRKIIEQIFGEAMVCRLALCDDGKPYIIPLNFGFENNHLYFHSASQGRKIEILKKNNNTCFEIDTKTELLKADEPCKWGMKYHSIIGFGKITFLENFKDKIKALNIIMDKYAPKQVFQYDESIVESLTIMELEISDLTGKSGNNL